MAARQLLRLGNGPRRLPFQTWRTFSSAVLETVQGELPPPQPSVTASIDIAPLVPTNVQGPGRSSSRLTSPVATLASAQQIADDREQKPFRLSKNFIGKFKDIKPPFGFNGLGEFVYNRTYSRIKKDGNNELWYETVERVVNGTYNMQKRWIEQHQLGWDAWKAQKSAQRMFTKIFDMKFLPPGRGLWAMGSPLTDERALYAALNNCAFVSTDVMRNREYSASKPFTFLMDASMLGVGVGFDTKAAEPDSKGTLLNIPGCNTTKTPIMYTIPDSREGWVASVGMLIDSFFDGTPVVEFNYSEIRPSGSPIKGFGGFASGPESLKDLHERIRTILTANTGKALTTTIIVDLMNLIGKCVVSGNVRQTAEIAFGDPDSAEYIDLKNYEKNPHRSEYGWTSNNSVICRPGMRYGGICDRVRSNGEPGFFWLENAQKYGRMLDPPNFKDHRAKGGNPCLEQTLEPFELCCLVETFPSNHSSLEDYIDTLEMAYLYAKTVTLGRTHWPESNRVMLRNRRIGCSMSGIAQFISTRGLDELRIWCDKGYEAIQQIDQKFSDWLAIPRSIKTTSVKPSGTVSILAGATPGMHYPESRYCIRRVRVGRHSPLIPALIKAGYYIEDCYGDAKTVVVEFPVDMGPGLRSASELSMWEQLSLAAFLQRHWSDNQVSCTVTFDPVTEGPHIQHALDFYQYQLKGVSFLPRLALGAYKQMPIEAITADEYHRRLSQIDLTVNLSNVPVGEHIPDKFCDSDACVR